MSTENETRGHRKTRVGVVVSNKMEKTVVVQIDTLVKHQVYHKYVRSRVKYKAHDEQNECKVGDTVLIEECRPLSKEKRWRVKEVTVRAAVI